MALYSLSVPTPDQAIPYLVHCADFVSESPRWACSVRSFELRLSSVDRRMGEAAVGIPFSCGANASLCFHADATCIDTLEMGQLCLCPADGSFIHDFTAGHFPNCTLPYWFLPAFFAITTAGTLWALWILVPLIPKLKRTVRTLVILFTLSVFFAWVHVMCVFVQKGLFAPGILFLALFTYPSLWASYFVTIIIVGPVYATLRRPMDRFKRNMKIFLGCLYSTLFVFQVALLVFAGGVTKRERDIYNAMFVGQLFSSALIFILSPLVTIIQVQRLEKLIKSITVSGDEPSRMVAFLQQLQGLKKGMLLMLTNGFLLILPIVVLTIGSLPYQFVYWALNASTFWMGALQARTFAVGKNKQSSEPGTSNSKSIVASPSEGGNNKTT